MAIQPKRTYTVKKNDPLLKNPAAILNLLRSNPSLAKRRSGPLLKPGDVIRVPVATTTGGMTLTSTGAPYEHENTSTNTGAPYEHGQTSGSTSTSTGKGGTRRTTPLPKPKPVNLKSKTKPKPRTSPPPPPRPLVKPVTVTKPAIRPQSVTNYVPPRQYSPLGGGGYTFGRPAPRPRINATAGVTATYRPPVPAQFTNVFKPTVPAQFQGVMQQPGGRPANATPIPSTFKLAKIGGEPVPAQFRGIVQPKRQPPKAAVNMFGGGAPLPPTVLPYPILQPDNTNPPFQVIDLQGNVSYGTSIVMDLLASGIRPLVMTPYDQNQLGLSDLEMEQDLGYQKDEWGNWIRQGESQSQAGSGVASNKGGGYGYGSGYGYGGGGGWGDGGGGYGYSPEAPQRRYGSEMGAVTWRI